MTSYKVILQTFSPLNQLSNLQPRKPMTFFCSSWFRCLPIDTLERENAENITRICGVCR